MDEPRTPPGAGDSGRRHIPPIPPTAPLPEPDRTYAEEPAASGPALAPADDCAATAGAPPAELPRTAVQELGRPQMQPIPEHRRWPLIVAVGVAVLVILGGVAWAALRISGPPSRGPGSSAGGPGSSVSTTGGPAGVATSGATATGTPGAAGTTTTPGGGGAGSSTGPGATGPGSATNPLARARLIAYRRDSALWVADDTGADRRRVGPYAQGVFALSPDGTRLAVMDPAANFLSIVDVATGRETTVGPAENRLPSWAPDGSWLAYTGLLKGQRTVMRVGRDGTSRATLASGFGPQVSADGKSVYFLTLGQDAGGSLARTDAAVGGRPVTVVVAGAVSAFAVSADWLACSTGQGTQASIVRARPDGTQAVRLVGVPRDPSASGYANLILSPDSRTLLYAGTGDDGYSRMSAVSLAGGSPVGFSARKDDYPMGWTVDSARIVFVSGNSFQGEQTDVVTVRADGTQRHVIVPGGGL